MSDSAQANHSSVLVFAPPYSRLLPLQEFSSTDSRGLAVIWHMHDAAKQKSEFEWLLTRPFGVTLLVVLPPATAIDAVAGILPRLGQLYPRGVLPNGPITTPEPIRLVVSSAPLELPIMAIQHLARAGILRDLRIKETVLRIFQLAPVTASISKLSKRLYTSRRTLGRFFESHGLPVPSHWLQFARLLHVAVRLQHRPDLPVFKVATEHGYPDGFTMSNQMKRLVGCRPTDVRERLGFEWLLEEWVRRECAAGRLYVRASAHWSGCMEGLKQWLDAYPTPMLPFGS